MTDINFLAIYDVVLDITEELQLSGRNAINIPLWQQLVKFTLLMPADGINWRDRYCELRWKATSLLKNKGYIFDFELVEKTPFNDVIINITNRITGTRKNYAFYFTIHGLELKGIGHKIIWAQNGHNDEFWGICK